MFNSVDSHTFNELLCFNREHQYFESKWKIAYVIDGLGSNGLSGTPEITSVGNCLFFLCLCSTQSISRRTLRRAQLWATPTALGLLLKCKDFQCSSHFSFFIWCCLEIYIVWTEHYCVKVKTIWLQFTGLQSNGKISYCL